MFSLICNFYQECLGIEIPDFFPNRDNDFSNIQKSVIKTKNYLELIKTAGFRVVKDVIFQDFDILLFNFEEKIHFAIFKSKYNFLLGKLKTKVINFITSSFLD